MEAWKELFTRYEKNPILTPKMWSYMVDGVFNPGATMFDDEVWLLVRTEDRRGYSHLSTVRSKDGKTGWQINPKPALEADAKHSEAIFGLEDPRIVWLEDRQEYIIACVSFILGVAGEPPGISLITTRDFVSFERLSRPLSPGNKDAALFPRTINGRYALINRPIIEGRGDIWVSFSRGPDLEYWGDHRVLLRAGHRSWDSEKVGIGPPPIETPEGWLIFYHGSRITASGSVYRVGSALLDLETLEVIRRSKDWVLGPERRYEQTGNVADIVFPCGAVVIAGKLHLYYGAADKTIGLATARLDEVLNYLKRCPAE